MARNYSAEAIVIKRTNLAESDRLITFLSRYRGKFTAIAKGIRKTSSRRAPNLELLNHTRAAFAQGKNLDVITEVETLESFKEVKEDLSKVASSFHLVEIVNELLEDSQGNGEIFELLLQTLRRLKKKEVKDLNKLIRAFEIKFLNLLGFRPQLYKCVSCSENLSEMTHFISPESGGVLHKGCVRVSISRPISPNSLRAWRFFQSEPFEKIERLALDSPLELDLEEQLRFYLEYVLEKQLKSVDFIDRVRREAIPAF